MAFALLFCLLVADVGKALALEGFLCSGQVTSAVALPAAGAAAKPAQSRTTGTRQALVLFARFQGEGQTRVPPWATDLFSPNRPGSFSHFYDTMSFGKLQVRGQVAPRVYESAQPASAYLSSDPVQPGRYGEFAREILQQADQDIDFAQSDNDGPDDITNSGDDDGVVDAVFIVLDRVPAGFLRGSATGMGELGLEEDFATRDVGASGQPIRISSAQGTLQQGRTFAGAVGAMCHEYGHVLGLIDLYNTDYLGRPGALPEEDAAGAGAWDLMGWGALGWNGNDGPNSLSAWSRERLGWSEVVQADQEDQEIHLEPVGLHGQIVWIPLTEREYLLLEYRTRASVYYDRSIPGQGLLVWHVERTLAGDAVPRWRVDLECADGRWDDAGYPLGQREEAQAGGDNLDFWAHDAGYAQAHGGNLGDATDPFDGLRFASFTPQTNPAAVSHDGRRSLYLEAIRQEGGLVRARLRLEPPRVSIVAWSLGYSVVTAGAAIAVNFAVANQGGSRATGLEARLIADDPRVEILDPEIPLVDLGVGQQSLGGQVSPQGFPRLRFVPGLTEPLRAGVALEVRGEGGVLLDRVDMALEGIPSWRVSGVVRAETGEPLAGIFVANDGPYKNPGVHIDNVVRTDAAGAYQFYLPPGDYVLTARPPADSPFGSRTYNSVEVRTDSSLDFVLPTTYHLTGVVRDADGNPVQGLWLLALTGQGEQVAYVATTVGGAYDLKIPGGECRIETYALGQSYPGQVVARMVLDADQVLDLQLQRGVQLTIRVVGERGGGVKGVRIFLGLTGDTGAVVQVLSIGSNGRGDVSVMPGRYTVSFAATPAPYLPPAQLQIEVVRDTTIQVALLRGLRVFGYLVDQHGQRLSNTGGGQVTFTAVGGGSPVYAELDVQGGFSVGLAAGQYRVYYAPGVGSPSRLPSQELGELEVRDNVEIQLAVRSGITLHGQVKDDEGRILNTGYLSFTSADGNPGHLAVVANGRYTAVLLPGEYRVVATASSGERTSLPQQVLGTFTASQDTGLDWAVRRGEPVQGRIADAAGQGIPGLSVSAEAWDYSTSNRALSGPDGAFSMPLLSGRYRLRASRGEYRPSVRWNLGEMEFPAASPFELRFPSGALLQVHLSTVSGPPPLAAGVVVMSDPLALHDLDAAGALVEANLDTSGRADIELEPGRYALAAYGYNASNTRSALGRVVAVLAAEGVTPVELVLPTPGTTVRLSGRVLDSQASRPPDALLQLYDQSQGIAAKVWTQDGRYQVDLPPGVYWTTIARYRMTEPPQVTTHGLLEIAADRVWDAYLGEDGTAAMEAAFVPSPHFVLYPNYPNPLNPLTTIAYQLPQAGLVRLTLYNVAGQVVRRLVDQVQMAGRYQVAWDGTDDQGREVGSGVYLYRLEAAPFQRTRRLVLVQ